MVKKMKLKFLFLCLNAIFFSNISEARESRVKRRRPKGRLARRLFLFPSFIQRFLANCFFVCFGGGVLVVIEGYICYLHTTKN